MRQKLALAASLLHRPSVLLLDEPTGGVDPVTRQAFWRLLVRLLAEGVAILITTPYMDEAVRCTRVAFLHAGRVLRQGRPSELQSALQGRILEVYGAPTPRLLQAAAHLPAVAEAWAFGAAVRLRLSGDQPELQERVSDDLSRIGEGQIRLRRVTPSLEDVFRDLLLERGR
jgi:ABC-2 type transport system ATP-binding protein